MRADRARIPPYGLSGGRPGRPSANFLNGDAQPSKLTKVVRRGDVFRHELAGGGGWGDPFERDPARVVADVRNGYVSAEAARRGLRRRRRYRPLGRRRGRDRSTACNGAGGL